MRVSSFAARAGVFLCIAFVVLFLAYMLMIMFGKKGAGSSFESSTPRTAEEKMQVLQNLSASAEGAEILSDQEKKAAMDALQRSNKAGFPAGNGGISGADVSAKMQVLQSLHDAQ